MNILLFTYVSLAQQKCLRWGGVKNYENLYTWFVYGPFADAKYLDKPSRIQIKFKARVSQLNFLSMQIGNFADVKCIPIQYTSLKCEDE